MAFDLSTARPEAQQRAGGFDLSTARPEQAPAAPVTDPRVRLEDLLIRQSKGEQGLEQQIAELRMQTDEGQLNPGQSTKMGGIGAQTLGAAEGLLSMGSGMIAQPLSGLAGLSETLNPFAEEGAGAKMQKSVQDALTYQPRTYEGKVGVRETGRMLEPAIKKLQELKQASGDDAFEKTASPFVASLAQALPEATLQLLGARSGSAARSTVGTKQAVSKAEQTAIAKVNAEEAATGIRQMTSDVFPPASKTGKFMQQQGENLAGGARVAQQGERIDAINNLFDKFKVTDGARFEAGIVDSVKRSINVKKAAAGELFDQSVKQLDSLGSVPLSETKAFASKMLADQSKLGTLADTSIVGKMDNLIKAPDGLTFDSIKTVRSAVGEELQRAFMKAPAQGDAPLGLLKMLYKNISKDMGKFADRVSPDLAKKWKVADEQFAKFAISNDKTAVKSVIRRGETNPEIIDRLLFSAKKSDQDYLFNNLDAAGRPAAKQRILQKILQTAAKDGETVSTAKFKTQIDAHRNQLSKFFDKDEKIAMKSLFDVLKKTERAQDANVVTHSGQQVIPLLAIMDPRILVPGVAQAILETPMIRNILIRRSAAKTAKAKALIDKELQTAINEAGLYGAATTGSITGSQEGI